MLMDRILHDAGASFTGFHPSPLVRDVSHPQRTNLSDCIERFWVSMVLTWIFIRPFQVSSFGTCLKLSMSTLILRRLRFRSIFSALRGRIFLNHSVRLKSTQCSRSAAELLPNLLTAIRGRWLQHPVTQWCFLFVSFCLGRVPL